MEKASCNAELDVVTGAAGPGRRLVIWLQGCLKRCPGCANGPFLPQGAARPMTCEQLLAIIDGLSALDGVSLSRGEPVLQAAALAPFLAEARERGHDVVVRRCGTGSSGDLVTSRDIHYETTRSLLLPVPHRIKTDPLPKFPPTPANCQPYLLYLSGRTSGMTPTAQNVLF